jgi:hypothetical protein
MDGETAVGMHFDIHENIEAIADIVAGDAPGGQRFLQIALAMPVAGKPVAQFVKPSAATPAAGPEVIAAGILDHGEHHVVTRRFGVEVFELLGRSESEHDVYGPGLPDMKAFAKVMQVEESAVANLFALGQPDPQDLTFPHLYRASMAGRYGDVRQQGSGHETFSGWR